MDKKNIVMALLRPRRFHKSNRHCTHLVAIIKYLTFIMSSEQRQKRWGTQLF